MSAASAPADVVAAYGWADAEIAPLTGGLINATYAVRRDGEPIAVVQRLHPTFAPEVNLDLEAVTAHVAARGMVTPRLIRTLDDRAWVESDGRGLPPTGSAAEWRRGSNDARVWRALTWVVGETVHAVPDVAWAAAGGRLVGEFHRAVADLTHTYRAVRAGVHDTAAHLAQLRAVITSVARDRADSGGAGADEIEAAIDLADEVLAAADSLPAMPAVPRRHVHGDLKISNVLFGRDASAAAVHGVALVDLDTLGLGTLAFELGDAMRSWCNPRGEDAGAVAFELPIFAAAIEGFRAVAEPLVTRRERESIVVGLETVCVELAARFTVDIFRDSYFGWDPARFASRRAHNLVRARGQLALALAVRAARRDAIEIVLAGT